jgi:hypothetical protein
VELDGFLHHLASLFQSGRRSNAAWEVWHVGAVSTGAGFIDYCVFHFRPACFLIVAKVFGCSGMEGWPAIVTVPALKGW